MLLVLCLLVSACACYDIDNILVMPDGPHMSERVYEKINEEEAYALLAEIADLCQSAENLEAVIEKRGQFFSDYYNKLATLITVANINADKDIYDEYWRTESVWISNFAQELHTAGIELEKIIFTSPCVDYFIEEYGQDYVDFILEVEVLTDEQLQLLATISELESQYYPLYYGTERTIDDMADLLRELVINRNAYARTIKDVDGNYYENYLEYAYKNNYGRDYTPDDCAVYKEAMKKNLYSLAGECYGYYQEYYPGKFPSAIITADQLEEYFPKIINSVSPDMMLSWDYMIDRELYDFTYSTTKSGSSYVVSFSEYDDAFLFLSPTTNFIRDMSTLVHEFGHYNAALMANDTLIDENAYRSYDLSETHSQALELLTLPAIEDICNEYYSSMPGLYQSYAINFMFNSLFSMLFGCAVDSFEYRIYTADEDELTTAFFRQNFLADESYYFPIKSRYEFPDISHIYTSPGYYISYSVSMVFSYVIWASENPIENYLKVVEYGSNNYLSTVCRATKLDYPFNKETIETIAKAIEKYVGETFA